MTSTKCFHLLPGSLVLAMWLAVGGCGGSSGGEDAGTPGIDGAPPAQSSGGTVGAGGVGMGGTWLVLPGSGGATGNGGAGVDAATPPACGQPGTPCCEGNACTGGGCCVSGICMAPGGSCVGLGGGLCNAGACGACGAAGLPCCGANPTTGVCTAGGTVCSAGTCTPCGELGTPCCAGANGGKCTAANAICNQGLCMACGVPGSACCPGNTCASPGCCYDNLCRGEGTGCGTSAGTCLAGRCSGCGGVSQPCCGSLCYDGLLCKGGNCTSCGGLSQACCPTTGGAAACQAGTACTSDGLCATCGRPGEMCCGGNACNEGCCSNGRCLAPSACPSPPDGGGQPDAPLGTGGVPGTGGVGSTGGAGGTSSVQTGGSTGSGGSGGSGTTQTGGVPGSGGTTVVQTGGIPGTGGAGGAGGVGGATTWIPPAGCGDKIITPPERCDDGNTLPFDGCSSDCQNEPVCNGPGPCTSRCGDGIVLGEQCDDGNTVDGDGCSASCTVEAGHTCSQPALGNRILVPVVYRDFRFRDPADFEAMITGVEKASPGMVAAALDGDGKPSFTGITGMGVGVTSAATFATWYRNGTTNHATPAQLALWDNGAGAYVNRYGANGEAWAITEKALWCGNPGYEVKDGNGNPIPCTYEIAGTRLQTDCDDAVAEGKQLLSCTVVSGAYQGSFLVEYADGNPLFFPVDGDTFSPTTQLTKAQVPPLYTGGLTTWPVDLDETGKVRTHNFSFTSEIRTWFTFDASQSYRLDVTGDDDLWVFVNKQLAVDLGGVHTPVSGSVTLDATTGATFGLVDGKTYEIAVFQAERQSTSSTLRLTLKGFNTAASVCQ